jgi:hypothetical protein
MLLMSVAMSACNGMVPVDESSQAMAVSGTENLLALHGGDVLTSTKTEAIFWGPEWEDWQRDPALFSALPWLASFLQGFGDSNYARTLTEYRGTTVGNVTTQSTFVGAVTDTSAAPSGMVSLQQVVDEVCKMTNNYPEPDAVYFVYSSTRYAGMDYCSWHSSGACSSGLSFQVAYLPNIIGFAGCSPHDTTTGNSEGLAALANQTARMLAGAITNPHGNGWYDGGDGEVEDRCDWTFTDTVTLSNGFQWKLQQLWSNNAYVLGEGSPRGCVQGN